MFYYPSNSQPRFTAKKTFATFLHRLLLPPVIAAFASFSLAAESGSVSLQFESQGLVLSSGEIVDHSRVMPEPNGADLYFSYHADRSTHATLMPSSGAEIALVSGTGMSEITVSDVTEATFFDKAEDQPLDSGSSALLRTADGSVFLIGNVSETSHGVSFNYMRLE